MNNIEKKICDIIEENRHSIFFIIICALAIFIRFKFRNYVSGDYKVFLQYWCSDFDKYGFFEGIRKTNANYNVPYMYILAIMSLIPLNNLTKVKLISIGFDFIASIMTYMIVKKVTKNYKFSKTLSLFAFAGILMNPTTIMNSSIWAQCDIIYVSFILISIFFIFSNRYTEAFIFYGISFSFKLQAIFVLPFFVILYMKNREFSITKFFIIPLVHVLLFLPAFLIGRPLDNLWNVYIAQVDTYKKLTMKFPNVYNFLPDEYDLFAKPGIIFTLVCVGIIMFIAIYNKYELNNVKMIELMILLLLVETYFLPAMHDRYLFCGDILAVLYIILKRRNILASIGILIISTNSYFIYLFKSQIMSLKIAALGQLFIIIFFFMEFLVDDEFSKKLDNKIYRLL